jgi:hypothetical protein
MLETPLYPAVLVHCHTHSVEWEAVSSDNPTGADNQQETIKPRIELDPSWVVGFVDGEGCFSVSIHKNPYVRRTRGWQVNPVFQVVAAPGTSSGARGTRHVLRLRQGPRQRS